MELVSMTKKPTVGKCRYDLPSGFCVRKWAFLRSATNNLAIGFIVCMTVVILAFRPTGPNTLNCVVAVLAGAVIVDIVFLIVLAYRVSTIFKKIIWSVRILLLCDLTEIALESVDFICKGIKPDDEGIRVIIMGMKIIIMDMIFTTLMKIMADLVKENYQEYKEYNRIFQRSEIQD